MWIICEEGRATKQKFVGFIFTNPIQPYEATAKTCMVDRDTLRSTSQNVNTHTANLSKDSTSQIHKLLILTANPT